MLLWKLLLNQQAGERCRLSDTKPEQPTPQVKHRWRGRCRQNRHPKHLHDEIDAGHDSSVKAVGKIARDDTPEHRGERRQTLAASELERRWNESWKKSRQSSNGFPVWVHNAIRHHLKKKSEYARWVITLLKSGRVTTVLRHSRR